MSDINSNQDGSEKKAKRPRIGTPQAAGSSDPTHIPHNNFRHNGENSADDSNQNFDRPYQPRPYQPRQGGYQPRATYQPRRPYNNNNYQTEGDSNSEGQESTYTPRPYQPRQGGYQPRQGGYQQRQGGYQQRQNHGQGGYQPRQGGYRQNQDQNQGQGGYQPRQGGYQQRQNHGQGGYQPRQGGYRQNQGQGGYQQRQGGYQQRQNHGQGGYQQRQGGYRPNNGRNAMYNQNQPGFFPGRGKSFTPRPKRIQYETPIPDPNEQIRLNKFMSNAGICSRREADEFIQQGLVKVNGQVVTELGTKITHNDVVEYDEKVLALESKCYILLNKPKDCVTTSDDPQDRTTVLDLVKGACNERIYPVGRLDRNTTGVLLLTNDGDLASKLTHPKYVKKKIYHVWTDRDISEEDMQRIADGIELEDGPVQVDAISYANETDRNQAGIEIHSGRNRIVRRIFESLGYHVTKLDRVYFAGLTKKNLPRGRWRYLTQEEVNHLKMGAFE